MEPTLKPTLIYMLVAESSHYHLIWMVSCLPGEIVDLNFYIQTGDYAPGLHSVDLIIYSNDPLNSELDNSNFIFN